MFKSIRRTLSSIGKKLGLLFCSVVTITTLCPLLTNQFALSITILSIPPELNVPAKQYKIVIKSLLRNCFNFQSYGMKNIHKK